jgi:hypothetical protein
MDHSKGASETGVTRLGFDRRVRLEFHGPKISSDGGLLLFRELDEVLGLHDIAGRFLGDTRTDHNRLHTLVSLLRQSVFARLAGYDDVNDADRLSLDPVMRRVVGGRAVEAKAASASQMGRFETEVLAAIDNRTVLADLSGHWIDRVHNRKPPKWVTLDMDSSVSPMLGLSRSNWPKSRSAGTCSLASLQPYIAFAHHWFPDDDVATKFEEKRHDWSVQRGVDHNKIRISPAVETRNRAQFLDQAPKQRRKSYRRLDRGAKHRQHARKSILLGECRFRPYKYGQNGV